MPEPRRGSGSRWIMRLYRALLLLYPAAFRQEYGQEMRLLFDDQCRDALRKRGVIGPLFCVPAAIRDTVTAAAGEHIEEWKDPMQFKKQLPTVAGFLLLTYSAFFVVYNILKYNLGVAIPVDPFAALTASTTPPIWSAVWNGLIIFGPVLALALFLLPSIRLDVDLRGERLITIALLRGSRLTLALIACCMAVFAVFFLYLIVENAACLVGSQTVC